MTEKPELRSLSSASLAQCNTVPTKVKLTQMLRSYILQPGTPHRPSTQYDLTSPRIERFQKLDNPTHRVCRQHAEVHNDFQVVEEQGEHFRSSKDGVVRAVLNAEVF